MSDECLNAECAPAPSYSASSTHHSSPIISLSGASVIVHRSSFMVHHWDLELGAGGCGLGAEDSGRTPHAARLKPQAFVHHSSFIIHHFLKAVALALIIHHSSSIISHSSAGEGPIDSPAARELGKEYQKAAEAVSPAVVHIASTRQIGGLGEDFFGRFFHMPRDLMALGSGVVVRSNGFILTNYHVVKGAETLRAKFMDGRLFTAQIVGIDPPTDLAVIKVEGNDLPVAELGDSDSLGIGHLVLAIGNPFGLDSTVTQGIISAKGRASVGIADYEDFIQTDAAINPGNSGGPLINIKGEVVGINTAIFSRSGGFMGIGFAIPSNMAKKVLDELISKGRVTRGYLGVTIQNVTPELARAMNLKVDQGAVVTDVVPGSPAEQAGFKKGDVIVEFEDRKVTDARQLRSMVATAPIGAKLGIAVLRNGSVRKVMVAIGEQKTEDAPVPGRMEGTAVERLGIQVLDLTDPIRQRYGIKSKEGVFVAGVAASGPADKAGIKAGAVILEVNHKAISNVRDFEKVLATVDPDDNVLLLVLEAGMKYYVVIRPG